MAKIKKKGASGQAKNYITRTQAVRKLQISLQDFRRLCIFKGIHPREPRNKKKVSKKATPATTFYYTRDIAYLLHEPLLQKFRDHKATAKKIARALGRDEVSDAKRLENSLPRMKLDHIVKERYPTFVDALRDLDDALSMLFLFANLPSTTAVPAKTIALCQRLCLEFEHYLIVSHSLKKTFLSIKGIYYQATVQGQDIMWLVPYRFVQKMTGDIDFRIMGTFIEFYTTLLGFVNYRLYTSIGLVYPPKFNASSDESGGELGAITLESKSISGPLAIQNGTSGNTASKAASAAAQAAADKVALQNGDAEEIPAQEEPSAEVEVVDDKIDTFETVTGEGADVLPQPQVSNTEAATLFSSFTFFLSRETPRAPLEFILKAFGCKRVGWDAVLGDGAFTTNERDPNITHQIVDRPNLPPNAFSAIKGGEDEAGAPAPGARSRVPGRIYVQPQWVWDCVNQGKLLRPDLYAPGATLPPHLSPWVKPKKGAYDPTAPLEEQEKEGEAELHAEEEGEESDAEEVEHANGGPFDAIFDDEVEAGEGMDVDGSESEGESEAEAAAEVDDEEEEDDEELSETEVERLRYQRELEAEAAGQPFATADAGQMPGKKPGEAKKKAELKKRAEKEELDRQRMMLPNKKRKLFDKMQYGNQKREAEAEKLRKKRRKLEKEKLAAQAAKAK
ncbi:hypothetical protein EJ06DRAFT_489685 [Trichodelitschia bisporula]|uniref:Pescadillo homolog n=1 Tax=Trichodelitschia bisporula TaxID=703511 RepID=A0A6G1I472_9PEZI|nr:hypothetical protein EJ06DRAFT_489685 [Trichodelitschia bisporula]